VTDKYELIAAEKANYPIVKMCDWIAVSTSGFYDWQARGRTPGPAARRRSRLARLVEGAFTSSRGTYGARRIVVVLNDSGERVSARLVAELMAAQELKACQPRPWRRTTIADGGVPSTPDRLKRDFTATTPGTKLVGDMTYIRTWGGWLYLATVIDLATRKVIGWSMATHMRTELIVDALNMAAGTRRLQPGCIFHSDRGSQYTSSEFAVALAAHNMLGSMGRTGICWDNAAAESFFAALKNELVYRTAFPTPTKARAAIAEYIEVFYNRRRLHSTLGYRTPAQAETDYMTAQIPEAA